MSSTQLNLEWVSPGPVSARFMASQRRVQILNGPIGSGKTTTALMKAIRLASKQQISLTDTTIGPNGRRVPVRKFRLCVVRDTYRQLWRSTLPSWFKRVPKEIGEWVGSENSPGCHRVKFSLKDGSVVDFQADFIAIGENTAEDVMRGYEPTCFYLNEADLLANDVFTFAYGRTSRFPDMSEGGPTWHGVMMDCNAPELSSWLYQGMFKLSAEEREEQGIDLFRQPSGLSPHAENMQNLVPTYYADQKKIMPAWYIRRMVENIPGFSRAGKPVFTEFNDALHVPDNDLAYMEGLPLVIGLDAGLNPAGVFCQRTPNGQWRIIRELVGEPGTGAIRFAGMLAKVLADEFPTARTIIGYADPSAAYGVDKKAGESTWIELVAHHAAIRILAAPTNALTPRLEAVRLPLSRLIDGQPGLLLSPRCKVLREGMNAGYRYKKKLGEVESFATDEPEKNEYSHPQDGLQYALSGGGEHAEIHDRRGRAAQGQATRRHVHDWDPLSGQEIG